MGRLPDSGVGSGRWFLGVAAGTALVVLAFGCLFLIFARLVGRDDPAIQSLYPLVGLALSLGALTTAGSLLIWGIIRQKKRNPPN